MAAYAAVSDAQLPCAAANPKITKWGGAGLASDELGHVECRRQIGWYSWCLTALSAQTGYIASCPPRKFNPITYLLQTDGRTRIRTLVFPLSKK